MRPNSPFPLIKILRYGQVPLYGPFTDSSQSSGSLAPRRPSCRSACCWIVDRPENDQDSHYLISTTGQLLFRPTWLVSVRLVVVVPRSFVSPILVAGRRGWRRRDSASGRSHAVRRTVRPPGAVSGRRPVRVVVQLRWQGAHPCLLPRGRPGGARLV